MKTIHRRALSLLLCSALLLTLGMGCALFPQQSKEPAQSALTTSSADAAEREQTTAHPSDDEPDKEETVYVEAAADGTPQKVTVEARLRNPGDGQPIRDRSNLRDLHSTRGDEDFQRSGDELLWDNHGEDVEYKGSSTQELPVSVHISYKLDGKPIAPESLAGKSGRVTIRFDYENHTEQTVTVTRSGKQSEKTNKLKKKGKKKQKTEAVQREITIPVPFVALTTLFLDSDTFSDVEAKNAELVRTDDQCMVVGYACSGLAESLKLTDWEPTEEVELPEYIEVTADVTDFSMDFTATVFTPELFNELEQGDLDDLDELTDGMDALQDASGELVKGTKQLSKGMKKLKTYLKQYTKGVQSAASGAAKLSNGLAELKKQTAQLQKGLSGLSSGDTEQLQGAQEQLGALGEFAGSVQQYQGAVSKGTESARESISGIDWDGVESDAEKKAVKQAKAQLTAAAEELGLTDEQLAALQRRMEEGMDLTGTCSGARDRTANALEALDDLPNGKALSQSTESLCSGTDALLSMLKRLSGANSTLEQLREGIDAYAEGVAQLSEGASQLSSGMKKLNKAGSALNKAVAKAATGSRKLARGFSEFDEDGIQELTDLAGEDLQELTDRLRAVQLSGSGYQSFDGLAEGQTGSVRFVVETEAIG